MKYFHCNLARKTGTCQKTGCINLSSNLPGYRNVCRKTAFLPG